MLNLKLKTIALLINKDDIVIDVACDHAYLAIYLKEHNLCKEVYASDISKEALNNANKNIKNSNLNIKTYLSDGLLDIPIKENKINTVIIAGVGTNTALNIVKTSKDIPKYIISSNNNHEELRKNMQNLGFYNEKEIVIKENKKYYPIIIFQKDSKKDNEFILKYGKSTNKEYYKYLLTKEKNIMSQIPVDNKEDLKKHQIEINNLEKIIKEKN